MHTKKPNKKTYTEKSLELRVKSIIDAVEDMKSRDLFFKLRDNLFYQLSTGILYEDSLGETIFRDLGSSYTEAEQLRVVLETIIACSEQFVRYDEFGYIYSKFKNREVLKEAVLRLRDIIEVNASNPKIILTLPRIGYKFSDSPIRPVSVTNRLFFDRLTQIFYVKTNSTEKDIEFSNLKFYTHVHENQGDVLNFMLTRPIAKYDDFYHEFGYSQKEIIKLMLKLRKKIESDPRSPSIIVNIPNVGYKLTYKPIEAVEIMHGVFYDTITKFLYKGKEATESTFISALTIHEGQQAIILDYFLDNMGRVIPYTELISRLNISKHAIESMITALNKKLHVNGTSELFIKNSKEVGYFVDIVPKSLVRLSESVYYDKNTKFFFKEHVKGQLKRGKKLGLKSWLVLELLLEMPGELVTYEEMFKHTYYSEKQEITLIVGRLLKSLGLEGRGKIIKNQEDKGYLFAYPSEYFEIHDQKYVNISNSLNYNIRKGEIVELVKFNNTLYDKQVAFLTAAEKMLMNALVHNHGNCTYGILKEKNIQGAYSLMFEINQKIAHVSSEIIVADRQGLRLINYNKSVEQL